MRKYRTDEDELLMRFWYANRSATEIAFCLSRTEQSIFCRAHQLKLRPRQIRGRKSLQCKMQDGLITIMAEILNEKEDIELVS